MSAKLSQIENLIDKFYYKDAKSEDIYNGALSGAVAALEDPYSSYFTLDEYNSFTEQVTGQYCGIGVTVTMDTEDSTILVVSAQKGTPADEAGLSTGDKIIAINGKPVPDDLETAVSKIKGKEGTSVKLTILKKDAAQTEEMEIIRGEITLDTLTSEIIEGDIGYVQLTAFDESTVREFADEIDSLEKNGAKSIILDLRSNPGGMVEAAQVVADTLLPECDITYVEYKSGKRQYYRSDQECYEGDVVVLVDGGSASASEIVAGALRDNDRAVIVGTQTFGKGLVQSVFPLNNDAGYVKLTIARYFTPDGEDINKKGITPHHVVELSVDSTEDLQLKKAIEVLKEK